MKKTLATLSFFKYFFGTLILLFIGALSIAASSFNVHPHNFGIVEEGKIYRSSQPDEYFLHYLINTCKIKTIVSLRGKVKKFERKIARENGIEIYSIEMSASREPTKKQIREFLDIVTDTKNQPVLVHCAAGADRTGVMLGILRMEKYSWTMEQTEKELFYYRNIPKFQPMTRNFLRKRYQ